MNGYHDKILAIKSVVERVHDTWVQQADLIEIVERVAQNFSDDIDELEGYAQFLTSTSEDIKALTQQNVDLLRRWHFLNNTPSLVSICMFAIDKFNLQLSDETLNAVLVAGILGEVENKNPYHNNLHFKKVLLQTIRMIAAHNDIYEGTSNALRDGDVALLLLAACVHDIGHDGMGNTVKGVFIQGRLEAQSYDLAQPYLEAAGYDDEKKLSYLRTMLLCTDTSPLGELSNPMNQMKAAYRFHFMGDKSKTHSLNLDTEFEALQKDERLTRLCLLLHEADIATSAGLNYEVTQYETIIFMRELRDDQAYPEQVIDFLNQICQRKMISDAGQRLYAGNLARIYALAEEDVKNGNYAFPDAEHSDLALASRSSSATGSKTIN